ncbi:UV DNA damage repair endonuclease UvsE [Pleurocapsales cyanobacterium LEGE 10410]|nr:UV DNA damage repair endonuclease UvsE [Pleurocapsales cyanobacterium LEGE 10410]
MQDKLPQLGLVCVTAADAVRFRTVTRRTLSKLTESKQQEKLRQVYADNIERLTKAIAFCQRANIRLYRLSSALFPFADRPIGEAILKEFELQLKQIGDRASKLGIRLVVHPNQFVVLNSDRQEVVRNSIKILKTQAQILDLLQLPRSPWALMNIHGGKGDRAKRLIENIRSLPDSVTSRLTLENDEHTYSSEAIAKICLAANIPMVFDAHHHLIHERLASYDDPSVQAMLELAKTTWNQPEWQLVHISNGKQHFHDTKHSDLIVKMPACFRDAPWIEVEAKQKELAIEKLKQEWLPSGEHQYLT